MIVTQDVKTKKKNYVMVTWYYYAPLQNARLQINVDKM